jgi:hypothetical protein
MVKGVQSFLGFCNFYRRFIREYGRIARPLTILTKKGIPFKWIEQCEEAFDFLKGAIVSTPVLRYYNPDLPIIVEIDALKGVVASLLS